MDKIKSMYEVTTDFVLQHEMDIYLLGVVVSAIGGELVTMGVFVLLARFALVFPLKG